ncbi:unnamed protein product, partial [Aphanomyces euteiches]
FSALRPSYPSFTPIFGDHAPFHLQVATNTSSSSLTTTPDTPGLIQSNAALTFTLSTSNSVSMHFLSSKETLIFFIMRNPPTLALFAVTTPANTNGLPVSSIPSITPALRFPMPILLNKMVLLNAALAYLSKRFEPCSSRDPFPNFYGLLLLIMPHGSPIFSHLLPTMDSLRTTVSSKHILHLATSKPSDALLLSTFNKKLVPPNWTHTLSKPCSLVYPPIAKATRSCTSSPTNSFTLETSPSSNPNSPQST